MPPVSAAPGLSVENLFGDLDPDEIIADEEDNQTPPPSTLGKRPLSPGQTDEDHNNDDDEENDPPGPESRGPRGRSSPGTQANPGLLRVEQVVRRLTKRLRLSDENVSLVEQFAQESSLETRLTLLYGNTVAVRDELRELQRSIGASSYQISEELEENIKKYTRVVLLSPSIFHYKGSTPRMYITIISKYRFGIPPNIEANGYAWGRITARVEHELTQVRSQLKKVLKRDAEIEDVQSRSVIYQLAKTMLSDENYKITPGICTRVALMRQAYTRVSDGRFWDEVDKVLDSIKSLVEEKRIPFLKKILNHDRKTYGVSPGTTAAAPDSAAMGRDDESPIQRLVEDAIASRGSRGVVHT